MKLAPTRRQAFGANDAFMKLRHVEDRSCYLIAAASDVSQATSVDLKTNLAAVFLKGGIVLHV